MVFCFSQNDYFLSCHRVIFKSFFSAKLICCYYCFSLRHWSFWMCRRVVASSSARCRCRISSRITWHGVPSSSHSTVVSGSAASKTRRVFMTFCVMGRLGSDSSTRIGCSRIGPKTRPTTTAFNRCLPVSVPVLNTRRLRPAMARLPDMSWS